MGRALWSLFLVLAGCSSASTVPAVVETTPAQLQPAPTEPAAAAPPTAAAAPLFTLTSLVQGAVLLPDLGAHKRKVTTTSAEAQQFFDQGLALAYGFNHDEAARAFAKAAALDPSCALCFWGAAYVLGPNSSSRKARPGLSSRRGRSFV